MHWRMVRTSAAAGALCSLISNGISRPAASDRGVDLGAARRAPEERLRLRVMPMVGGQNLVDDEPFPADAAGGMHVELTRGAHPEEVVQQPGVPEVDLRALHEAFADVW